MAVLSAGLVEVAYVTRRVAVLPVGVAAAAVLPVGVAVVVLLVGVAFVAVAEAVVVGVVAVYVTQPEAPPLFPTVCLFSILCLLLRQMMTVLPLLRVY